MDRSYDILPVYSMPEAARYIVANLRPADLAEIAAGSGGRPEAVIGYGLTHSESSGIILVMGEPLMIFGCVRLCDSGVGSPWAFGTPAIKDNALSFMRATKEIIDGWMHTHRVLFNRVHAANKDACRFLESHGFTLERPYRWGVNGDLFHEFYKVREDHHHV